MTGHSDRAVGFARLSALFISTIALCGARPAAAQQDFTFGGDARAFAMGGAGIALLGEVGGNRVNPASLLFEVRNFDFRVPTIAIRANNDLSLNKVYDYFTKDLNDAGRANDLARSFLDRDSEFGFSGNLGVRYRNVEITGFAVGKGKLQMNEALKSWIRNGRQGSLQQNAPDARADIIAAGYYNLPAVGFALPVPQPAKSRQTMSVGIRVKAMRAFYAHYLADARALDGDSDSFTAPEMLGKDYLDKRGFGADVGFLMRQTHRKNGTFSAGMIIANLINPRFKFRGTDRNGNLTTTDLVKTTASTGIGYEWKGLTAAADIVDITSAIDSRQFRTGAEYRLPFNLALRGGYSSAGGFTYGAGIFGFNVAFGKNQPLEVVRTINF